MISIHAFGPHLEQSWVHGAHGLWVALCLVGCIVKGLSWGDRKTATAGAWDPQNRRVLGKCSPSEKSARTRFLACLKIALWRKSRGEMDGV